MQPLLFFGMGCLASAIIAIVAGQFIFLKYRKQLYFDKLTGLKNAIFLDKAFNKFLQPDTCFMLVDIDNFKQLNTEFGYVTADEILKSFVKIMMDFITPEIEIFRYRFGDEFLIIMNNKSKNEAVTFLNDISQKLHSTPLKIKDQKFLIYFSAGITLFKEGDTQSSLVVRLIKALTEAKLQKNHFVVEE